MSDRTRPRPRNCAPWITTTVLLAIISVGAAFRFLGVGWGLPQLLHADEWVVVEGAIDMAQRNSFEPGFFFRPDHLEIQWSYLAYQLWSHGVLGLPPEVAFARSPEVFYAISRSITAVIGTAMIPLAYAIGRGFSTGAGLWMAGAVAFFPPFVEHSHYATPDIPVTFALMLTILGCVRYMRTQRWMDLGLAVFGVALGTTAKYPALIACAAVAVAVIQPALARRKPLEIVTRGGTAVVALPVMIFALSPVLFTNMTEVRNQLFQQNSTGHLGADGMGWSGNLAYYADRFFLNAGWIVAALALIGCWWLLRNRRVDALPLLTGLVFWVAISALSLHWERWGLPMYLSGLLLAGLGASAVWNRVQRVRTGARRPLSWGAAAVTGLASASLVFASAAHVASSVAPDTRSRSAAELAAQGISADQVFFDGYTPFLTDGPALLTAQLHLVDGHVAARFDDDTQSFVLTSSLMVNRVINNDQQPEARDLYRAVAALPILQQWSPVPPPALSPWAIQRIAGSVGYIADIARGGLAGPHLVLHELRTPH